MEYETDDSNLNWWQKVKESPRTVSALIIILIVAAAIYAFSGDQTKTEEQAAVPAEQVEEATPTTSEEAAAPAPSSVTEVTPVTQEAMVAAARSLPEARKTDTAYVEVAQKGDGLTHLARRATARYLAENNAGYTVTKEHQIYIEDYIKDHLTRHPVKVGQEETISFDLIKDAVAAAGQLSETQLKHLTKYTSALK